MEWEYFLIGIVFWFLVAFISRSLVVYHIEKNIREFFKEFCKKVLKLICCLFSSDYFFDYVVNEDLEKTNKNKYFTSVAVLGVTISFIVAICAFLVRFLCDEESALYYIVCSVMGIRVLSRTMELNIVFIKDILSNKNESDISGKKRIKLALLGLLEEAILFMGLYAFMLSENQEVVEPIIGGLHSFIFSPYNAEKSGDIFFKIASVYQIICSVILITLSFTAYFSEGKDKLNENNLKGVNENNNQNTTKQN